MFVSRKRMLEILEQAQEGDRTSLFVDRFLSFLIVTNILAVSLNPSKHGIAYRQAFLIFEYFSVVIFGLNISCVSGPAPNAHPAPHKQ